MRRRGAVVAVSVAAATAVLSAWFVTVGPLRSPVRLAGSQVGYSGVRPDGNMAVLVVVCARRAGVTLSARQPLHGEGSGLVAQPVEWMAGIDGYELGTPPWRPLVGRVPLPTCERGELQLGYRVRALPAVACQEAAQQTVSSWRVIATFDVAWHARWRRDGRQTLPLRFPVQVPICS